MEKANKEVVIWEELLRVTLSKEGILIDRVLDNGSISYSIANAWEELEPGEFLHYKRLYNDNVESTITYPPPAMTEDELISALESFP